MTVRNTWQVHQHLYQTWNFNSTKNTRTDLSERERQDKDTTDLQLDLQDHVCTSCCSHHTQTSESNRKPASRVLQNRSGMDMKHWIDVQTTFYQFNPHTTELPWSPQSESQSASAHSWSWSNRVNHGPFSEPVWTLSRDSLLFDRISDFRPDLEPDEDYDYETYSIINPLSCEDDGATVVCLSSRLSSGALWKFYVFPPELNQNPPVQRQ